MREVERSAPSVEEAVEAALAALGVSEQEAEVEVLQEPRAGFLGIGSQEAIVRVRVREAEPDVQDLDEQGELAADFLEDLLDHMGIAARAEPTVGEGVARVEVASDSDEDIAIVIGRHGQTLDALQELTRLVVSRRLGTRARVVVDAEGYRRRRRSRLASRAREVARRVRRTGREEELEPMTAFERKVVHDAVAKVEGVTSTSRGEEPQRRVVIRPDLRSEGKPAGG